MSHQKSDKLFTNFHEKEIRNIVLSFLKKDFPANIFNFCSNLPLMHLLVLTALLRDLILLLTPEEQEKLLKIDNLENFIKELIKIKRKKINNVPLKRERNLVLAAVTRYFSQLEKDVSLGNDFAQRNLQASKTFWNDLFLAVQKTLTQLENEFNNHKK